jgi:hypothetical protein
MDKNIQLFAVAFILSMFNVCYGGAERLRNTIHLFLKFLMVKTDPLNVISYKVAVYNNVKITLNKDLL